MVVNKLVIFHILKSSLIISDAKKKVMIRCENNIHY